VYGGVPPAADPVKAVTSGISPDVGIADALAASGPPIAPTVTVTFAVVVVAGAVLSVTVSVAV
jgi:hypothetical protein